MPSLLPLLLSLSLPLALALPAPQIDPQVPTTGTIAIYKTTSSAAELELGAKLGCLDASGRLSSATTACAKYSLKEGGAYNAATEKGECGFHDSSEPRNEMAGVQDWFAWRCKAGLGNVGVGDAVGVIVCSVPFLLLPSLPPYPIPSPPLSTIPSHSILTPPPPSLVPTPSRLPNKLLLHHRARRHQLRALRQRRAARRQERRRVYAWA
ncbi:hypothetical protein BDV95DRAFT_8906 [Massariosphaeria phaeospora]|uniref:Uncharacterized protein n=1 Tax=Massariosphaeria phaeospora TaxID=100035 RepID=A0A7C8MGM7_9PLEO|nr:hypothetical protein BDV95DRAFT_8906 [Massariosphaeria phaeospora]